MLVSLQITQALRTTQTLVRLYLQILVIAQIQVTNVSLQTVQDLQTIQTLVLLYLQTLVMVQTQVMLVHLLITQGLLIIQVHIQIIQTLVRLYLQGLLIIQVHTLITLTPRTVPILQQVQIPLGVQTQVMLLTLGIIHSSLLTQK